MHCTADFSHFNHVHWIAIQCEMSGAGEATPAVSEASEATYRILLSKRPWALVIDGPKNGGGRLHGQAIYICVCITHIYTYIREP